ncbi:serine--tRNA ligase [Pseudonocardia acaciae]|uniref:serine--tRNA ligase n=1 Tax=Pseudonocardia acaciae TaxID=551276 RepID=UPI00048EB0D8|nr:serine--tRNA ligase [Pseudonocardia acaciae]
MIDLKLLRDDPEALRRSQRARGEDPAAVDALLVADERRREAVGRADTLRAEQRQLGKKIGRASGDERAALLERGKELAAEVKDAESAQTEADQALVDAQRSLSNLVIDGVPEGGEDDYVVLEHVGTPREFDFDVRDHLELAEGLGAVDMERGAKVSGARFFFLTGVGAQLQLALLNLAMQRAIANGFTMVVPPVLVKPEIMEGTGFLGAHAAEVYRLRDDDLYLVGTSEVPLAGYHAGEIIDLSSGARRYAGWSSCFRREAGSYGKDTRGIIRVHQFDKIEMFSYCRPEDSQAEHQRLLGWERDMLAAIEVPYRVIDVAAGDLGSSAARKYDCEGWLPSQNRYRELTSTSNCTTFQARRLNVRYRDDDGRTQVAATLNGTLATTRWIVAILENHQRADGSVTVPEQLRPLLGRDVLTP